MKKIMVLPLAFLALVSLWYFFSHKRNQDLNVIVVGTNAEYPPFTFINEDRIVGFDIDIISEIGKRLGKKIEFKDMPFDVLIPEIQRGSVHVIAAGMTPTPEREKEVLFTQCYFSSDPLVIVTKPNKRVEKIEDLNGKEVIVNDGYTADLYMSNLTGPLLKRLPTPSAAFLALEADRADAYVAALSTVSRFLKSNNDSRFVTTTISGTEERYAFAVSPQQPKLLPLINKIISDMMNDGSFKTLRQKWGIE